MLLLLLFLLLILLLVLFLLLLLSCMLPKSPIRLPPVRSAVICLPKRFGAKRFNSCGMA